MLVLWLYSCLAAYVLDLELVTVWWMSCIRGWYLVIELGLLVQMVGVSVEMMLLFLSRLLKFGTDELVSVQLVSYYGFSIWTCDDVSSLGYSA